MGKYIVILTGEIRSGKSTIAKQLQQDFGFHILKTSDLIRKEIQTNGNQKIDDKKRPDYQKLGAALDDRTNGTWVMKGFSDELKSKKQDRFVIDSCRILKQIKAFRDNFRSQVFHVHVKAPEDVLRKRFEDRDHKLDKQTHPEEIIPSYEQVKKDSTEAQVKDLEKEADLVIDTDIYQQADDSAVAIAGFLRLLPPLDEKLVDVVVGGQFGSEGKGSIVGFLAPEYDCLVRVGGPNAGHKVYAEPEPEKYQILPSGTSRAENAILIIGPGAVIDEKILLNEIREFGIDVNDQRLFIDGNATVISEKDKLEEAKDRIGSTKKGVGAATGHNLFENRLSASDLHKAKHNPSLHPFIADTHQILSRLFTEKKKILLECTQGTLLSLHHGDYPHVTSRDTTISGCLAEAGIPPARVRKCIMVVRRYPIRVGNPTKGVSGDFGSKEVTWEYISDQSGIPVDELKEHELGTVSGKLRRVAEFSWKLFRKACELNAPTDIAFTFADYIHIDNREARRFNMLTGETQQFIQELEQCAGVPVSLVGVEFNFRSILDRRNWR